MEDFFFAEHSSGYQFVFNKSSKSSENVLIENCSFLGFQSLKLQFLETSSSCVELMFLFERIQMLNRIALSVGRVTLLFKGLG
jgi:hypothetical protein